MTSCFQVICGNDQDLLANTNAVMRRIDLMCKLLAPILVGVAMSAMGPLAGAVLIGLWHFCSVVPEYIILTWVYVLSTVH
jgi:iron-regulated transporter 1